MRANLLKLLTFFFIFCIFTNSAWAQGYNKTVGSNVYGSIQLVDTLPVLDPGIGGGLFFDYRFNDRFSIMIESFFTTQDGDGRSNGEGNIIALAVPAVTLKIYILNNSSRLEPYFGIGVGLYALTEGNASNNTGGVGLGAQFETGLEFMVAENLMMGVGGTFRSAGLINSLSGNANATTYMPFTLFGRIGYKW